ncbi:unnamed protein product [Ambrosiozyma monospora]|uniref:Unnamed protein product n=1 Tax=Ambrosiozyma monospora TaxID=43982 RepID=A0A9W6YYB9_AMBMO|nr:unnamed protein product [Ambrosiozyma monospora]
MRSASAPTVPSFGESNKPASNPNTSMDESNATSSSTDTFGNPPTTDFSSDGFSFVGGSAPSVSSNIGGATSTSGGGNGGVDPLYRRQSILSPSSAMESDSAPPLLPQVAVYLVDDLNHHLGSFSTSWNSIGRAICRVSVLVLRIAVASDASHQVGFSLSGSSNASANARRRSTNGTIAGGATEISRALNRFQHNVGEFLKSDSGSLVSDQLVVIPQLELMLECFQNHFDDYQLATIVTFWCSCIGDKGLGVMPDPDRKKQNKRRDRNGEYEDEEKEDMNPLVLKKKGMLHRLVLSKLLFVNRSLHSFLIDTKMPKAREELYSNAILNALSVLMSPMDKFDMEASRLSLGVLLSTITTSFGQSRRVVLDLAGEREIYLVFARLLPTLGPIFNKYLRFTRKRGHLTTPKCEFTSLFPSSYPFPEMSIDSNVRESCCFSELMLEFTAVMCMLAQVGTQTSALVHAILADLQPYPEGSYVKLNKYIPSVKQVVSDPVTLLASLKCFRYITDPIYYPASKWVSLHAVSIVAIEEYLVTFSKSILRLLNSTAAKSFTGLGDDDDDCDDDESRMEKEEAEDVTDEDERSLNFITHLFTNYFVPLFKGANAKPSSLEHLTNLPQKACYQLTANLRTKTVEAVYVTWCSLGKPASVQDRFRFGLDRFGGFQRLLYSDESYGVIKQILLCGMQRNSQCQELCSKMFWSVIVSEWVQWRSLDQHFDCQLGKIG